MELTDTDILIDIQRKHAPAVAWFQSLGEPPSVPGLVVMELIQNAGSAAQVRRVQQMVAPFPVVWPSEDDCRRALADYATLHVSHGLGLIDALIAATAVGRSARLCTFNMKHFRVVPGLVIHQPYLR